MKNDRLDAALEYVRRGWEIFPCPPGLKCGYSIESRGFDNGAPWGKTTSVKEVREYWKRLPRANIGVPMGIGSGIFDIEVDTVVGHANLERDGAILLAELEAKHGKLPPTLMFESPTGSRHHLFRHPGGDVRIRMGALVPGVDCKGDGGMSVVPPSRTRKGVYRWINKRRIARAPQWLLTMVIKQEYAPRELDVWEQFANSTKQVSMNELTLAAAMIPNADISWDPDKNTGSPGWNAIGMALYAATDGSAEGFRLFDAFSQRSSKYNAKTTRDKWKAFHKCPPREIGAGTIFFLAEEAVPDYRDRCIAQEPEVIALIEEFHKLMDAS
jgi:Bifunctional DNA primase/polymerase, N-terminal/Primase C terminal 2 (PriCT-2)